MGIDERNEGQAIETRPLDPYLTMPADPALPPLDRSPIHLPFDQQSAEDFERTCVAVASYVDGLRDVRQYGISGQAQYGIDLVGWDADGKAVVYQSKRWVSFSENDLRKVVELYAQSHVFSAKRFVVCVATSASRTEIIDELHKLKREYEFEVDLYDRERLSEMLRQRKDLVARFFGEEWARLFCSGELPKAPRRPEADVTADALLRGPLKALNLAGVAAEADSMAAASPSEAALGFQKVVAGLDASAFAGLSDSYRLREADCWRQAGETLAAVELLSEVSWRQVGLGAGALIHKSTKMLEDIDKVDSSGPGVAALLRALKAVARWDADPFYDLSDVLDLVKELHKADSPGTAEFAMWLAESLVTDESLSAIQRISATLEAVASDRELRDASDEVAARIRVCVAEATGDWGTILTRAQRGSIGRRQAFLVHARMGRSRTWNAEPEEARTSYSLAIDQACQASLQSEGAAALLSVSVLGARYGLVDVDWLGASELARDIRRGGTDYLVSAYDHRAGGLAKLSEGKLPAAFSSLRANLRSSIIAGRLAAELDAHSLLGRLYLQVGEPGLAAGHQIRAGDASELEKWCAQRTEFLDCSGELARPTPWERAATLGALAAQGDLIPDGRVAGLVVKAIEMGRGQSQGFFGPQVWHSAHKLLASVATRIPDESVEAVLDQLEPQIPREPNRYRYNDEQHVRIVAGILSANPHHRERATTHLLALLGASPELGDTVLSKGLPALRDGGAPVVEGLIRLADEGSKAALRALLYLDVEHPLLLEEARDLFKRAVERPERQPGVYGYGTILPRAAGFVRLLDEASRVTFAESAMEMAEDSTDVEFNRVEALNALSAIADVLPDSARVALFATAMSLASDPKYCGLDEEMQGGHHPLSRVQINMSNGQLASSALQTAAELASTEQEYRLVVSAVWPQFEGPDSSATILAARTIARIPAENVDVDVGLLATSQMEIARQLAAVIWSHHPNGNPAIGEALATDDCLDVRRAIAESLVSIPDSSTDLATSLAIVLENDASAAVRAAAKRALINREAAR